MPSTGIEDLRATLPGPRTAPLAPRTAAPGRRFADETARRIVEAIDEIAHEHAGTAPDLLPGEVFRTWWRDRPAALRGGDDGLDALRARVLAHLTPASRRNPSYQGGWWDDAMIGLAADPPETIRYQSIVGQVTEWLAAENVSGTVIDECLDALEASLAAIPADRLLPPPPPGGRPDQGLSSAHDVPDGDWRGLLHLNPWRGRLQSALRDAPGLFTAAALTRWLRLERWIARPCPDTQRLRLDDDLLAVAHRAGAATDGDIAEAFLTPHNQLFATLTGRWRSQAEAEHPTLVPIADRVRDRLVEAELRRGDLPTPTSDVVRNVGSVAGVDTACALLAGLAGASFARGSAGESRDIVYSHLLRVSFPGPGETGAALRESADRAGVPVPRLIDLALHAPQWAPCVEEAVGWPGLASGVLWLHGHTRDTPRSARDELRGSWAAMIGERTALSGDDLMDGAVDVDWFRSAHGELGQERWSVLLQAAKAAAGDSGHRRARLFTEAMLGQADEASLAGRITGTRDADAVRALGLLPLPGDPAARQEATARRYALLREFERGAAAFGGQRRASEGTAARIGIENMARAAGYADPRRFIWAAETAEAADLAGGPVTAPRKTALARQFARVRAALADAMIAQDTFTAADFGALARHPVLAPMLGRLVWVTDGAVTLMRSAAAELAAKAAEGPLRIAHPSDMVADGTWIHWQEKLFKAGTRQPFKQVFRELYVLTAAERAAGPASARYDGHQVQPRQALALLGGRGWVTSHESGDASRAFRRHGYVARVGFDSGLFAAAGELPAIDGVHFTRAGDWLAQPLASVPPVVFSETMRDLDLVVSVAHAGGVNPEATASTIAMRAALIRETARLLQLDNVRFAGSRALIDGRLGQYAVHLGSGTVHRRPGGPLRISAAGCRHRGRLFLPFADDDPKTAEIVSKVMLLARDHQVKDPAILEQLVS